jgi:hypothetical protein
LVLDEAIPRLRAALARGGRLVAAHWTPRTRTYPTQGPEVHALLAERLADLRRIVREEHPRYLLDAWERS